LGRFGVTGSESFRSPHGNACCAQGAAKVSRYDGTPANRFRLEFRSPGKAAVVGVRMPVAPEIRSIA
jgi:hypothetical protein